MDYSSLLPYSHTDRQREVLNTVIDVGSQNKAAALLGIKRQTVADIIKTVKNRAAKQGFAPEHDLTRPVPDGFVAEVSTLYGEDGEVKQQWVKGKADKARQEQLFVAFIEGLATAIKPARTTKAPAIETEELLSAIVIGDGHLGMLAHQEDTLDEDFSIEVATSDLRAAIDYLVHCAPAAKEGVLVNVGDFLHMDDTSNATPASGHTLDVDVRHPRLMRIAGATLRYAIDKMLTKFQQVRVVNAAGNHDPSSAVALSMFLEGVYEQHDRVIVEPTESKFYFLEFGKNLIGITHGDRIPANRLAGVMTSKMAEAWGRTKFRRWWVGHVHHKRYQEMELGCSIESFNTLAATDSWHAMMGYGAERGIEMITLHREFGQVGRINASLDLVRAHAIPTTEETVCTSASF